MKTITVPMQVEDTADFYAKEQAYLTAHDPTFGTRDAEASFERERDMLPKVLGEAAGRSALDLTCGPGGQAIALAALGWKVTGLDLTPAYLDQARARAQHFGVSVDFKQHDARQPLPEALAGKFDASISCMALDNILDDTGLATAMENLRRALRPGGMCYIRLRDLDFVMDDPDRYAFKEERKLLNGRLIILEDWINPGDGTLVNSTIFALEDHSRPSYPFESTVFSYQRRALRKAELMARLSNTGFSDVTLLPQEAPWFPYEVTAIKKD